MKVLIINAHFTKVLGGSEVQCNQIADGLTKKGVKAIYMAVGGAENLDKFNYDIVEVKKKASAVLSACIEHTPDIVYWRYNKKFLAPVAKEMHKRKVPLVFSVSHIHDLKPFSYKPIPGLSLFQKLKRRAGHYVRGWQYAQGLKKVSGIICNNSVFALAASFSRLRLINAKARQSGSGK